MDLNEYQERARGTAIYPGVRGVEYCVLGLVGEAGELANKYKKIIRDKGGVASLMDDDEMAKELGDVLWYVACLAGDLGYKLDEIAAVNLTKLDSRKARGTLTGSGDNR